MADWGSILDDIRHIGDDVNAFFDTSLGKGIGAGAKSLVEDTKKQKTDLREGFAGYEAFAPRDRGRDLQSEDFYTAERAWMARLRRFSEMSTGTEVRLGGK